MKNIDENNGFDHGTHQEFLDYYSEKSLTESSMQRMRGIFDCINRNLRKRNISKKLIVADIGCGVGVLSSMWAREGHTVHGLDVNESLLEVARQRAASENLKIDFRLGSATNLPWHDRSMDICIAPELLEHVADWQGCLREFARILKPNGVIFISTTNKLCPRQEEFTLPFYSWYPRRMKHHYENLARTTRPEIAGYATYPAVNWFSYYELRDELSRLGMESFDRFDIMGLDDKPFYQVIVISMVLRSRILRWLGHVATPGLILLAIKNPTEYSRNTRL
ncbi:class I SAM-dependent methyltransferase [Thiocystis violacea]|uniref:class I SAM-dependent methyltransferase n=1 Tax=Thiocystis violacea TaxID=13725 RepID=UPI0019085346|nr:class I SAM-dependent methyltransferase [Thiocystis violacea]MBK1724692.1 hypothetical protein [Thiocystis violacea]